MGYEPAREAKRYQYVKHTFVRPSRAILIDASFERHSPMELRLDLGLDPLDEPRRRDEGHDDSTQA
jgi:hypothetical protein